MARVTRSGGPVAACVWDHAAGGQGPLTPFFLAAHELDPAAPEESERPGTRPGHLAELFREAGPSWRGSKESILDGRGRASELRGMVGAVRARSGADFDVRGAPRSATEGAATRALPRGVAAGRAVRRACAGLGGARHDRRGLTSDCREVASADRRAGTRRRSALPVGVDRAALVVDVFPRRAWARRLHCVEVEIRLRAASLFFGHAIQSPSAGARATLLERREPRLELRPPSSEEHARTSTPGLAPSFFPSGVPE